MVQITFEHLENVISDIKIYFFVNAHMYVRRTYTCMLLFFHRYKKHSNCQYSNMKLMRLVCDTKWPLVMAFC